MRVVVYGDACVDVFVYGNCPRLCPEAPVPVFIPLEKVTNDGMALNVAANLKAVGVSCTSITNEKSLITKTRFVETVNNQMIVRVDQELQVPPFSGKVSKADVVVVADYDKGFLTTAMMEKIAASAPLSFLDTKKPLGSWCEGYSFIKINKQEHQKTLRTITPSLMNKLIVTLSGDGCMFQGVTYAPEKKIQVVNVCGAGDTFMAGFVANYLTTKNTTHALTFALDCASTVVQQRGVVTP